MDDQDFQFRVPAEKKEPRPFEPPPWEKDAFEELEKRRAESAADEVAEAPSAAIDEEPAPRAEHGRAPVAEGEMLELLGMLAEEEPRANREYWRVGAAVGLFLVALGGVLIIWATAAWVSSMRTGVVGTFGGTGLGLFGVFFMSMGVWMMYRTLKQR